MTERPRDLQRNKVYEFELQLEDTLGVGDDPIMSLSECQSMVNRLCLSFGIKPSLVTDGRGRKRAAASQLKVKLPRQYRDRMSVIHETVHTIIFNFPEFDVEAFHGPTFVRHCLHLFAQEFDVFTECELVDMARSAGVQVSQARVIKVSDELFRKLSRTMANLELNEDLLKRASYGYNAYMTQLDELLGHVEKSRKLTEAS